MACLTGTMASLQSRYGVDSLALLGSVARGQGHAQSDVDVLVTCSPAATVTLLSLARLTTELEATLDARVDLVEDHAALRPSFRSSLQRDMLRVA